MKVYQSIDEFHSVPNPVFTMGMFDGVHLGHQEIIKKLNQTAEKINGDSCLLTFNPHPRFVLQKDCDLKLLNTQEEKIELLEKAGLQNLIIHPFTKEFSRLGATEFVRDILVNRLGMKYFLVGYDHHFGRNREGNFEQLQELADLYGFELEQIDAVEEGVLAISSTKIRNALWDGNLDFASRALGYNYLLSGKVVHGDKIGKSLGFPTINIAVDSKKLIPKDGVYGVEIKVENQWHFGVMNIGIRPTVSGKEKRIEIFVFDFEQEIYDSEVTVKILTRLREEQKFDDKTALVAQIQEDVIRFKEYLKLREFKNYR